MYDNVTLITDLICALFGPYASMFVNRIYPGKSLKTSFVSPGKPGIWSLQVLESPGKQYFTVCMNPDQLQLAETESASNVIQLFSAETECPLKVPIYPHLSPKPKPNMKFGRPLTIISCIPSSNKRIQY